ILKEKKEEFPCRKDLTYWILMLILVLIFLFVFCQKNPSLVNSQLALLTTVSSITLAVIAIIFSFIQSSLNTKQLNDILKSSMETAGKLNIATNDIKELMNVSDILKKDNEKLLRTNKDLSKILKEFELAKTDEQRNELQLQLKNTLHNSGIYAEITVPLNDRTLYNTIQNEFGNEWTLIQSVWRALYNRGIDIGLDELKGKINKLVNQGNAELDTNNEKTRVSKEYKK